MNKYIRKCLIVYTSLALILVGMAGAAYAITATDADNYVTRSQYAVDMAHLQNKLDEQEAGLMGNINRFRSTNVRFVTWDTPQQLGVGNARFSGGNYFLNIRNASGALRTIYRGVENSSNPSGVYARLRYITLHRLWNGNYYISTDKVYKWTNNSGTTLYSGATYNCAVPCENLPGYYLILSYNTISYNSLGQFAGLFKLDPNVQSLTAAQIAAAYPLKFRFKKDLWQYYSSTNMSDTNYPWNAPAASWYYYSTSGAKSPLNNTYTTDPSYNYTGTANLPWRRYFDPDNGDYMVEVSGMKEAHSQATNVYYYDIGTGIPLIPKDNVEYLMYGTGALNINGTGLSSTPPNRYVTTRQNAADIRWTYEFVDCENGIKYWHAYKSPAPAALPTYFIHGWHYSLPIVY